MMRDYVRRFQKIRRNQGRVLVNVCATERDNIVSELWNCAVVLEIDSYIRITVLDRSATFGYGTDDIIWSRSHGYTVGAHFQVVVCPRLLPSGPPVRGETVNVKRSAIAVGVRLAEPDMFGAVPSHIEVEMIVPHSVSTEPSDIRSESAVEYCGCCGLGRVIVCDERIAPYWCAVPEVLDAGGIIKS